MEKTAKGEVLLIRQKFCIPRSISNELLQTLHATHSCSENMWRTMQGIWMWPALKKEIKSFTQQCPACAETARSNPNQPPLEIPEEMIIMGTMDRMGVNLLHYKEKDFPVIVDHYSN